MSISIKSWYGSGARIVSEPVRTRPSICAIVMRRLALRRRNKSASEASPVNFAASSRYSLIRGYVSVRHEIVGVGAFEDAYLDRLVGLRHLNQRD
jgi:hypothetical protein